MVLLFMNRDASQDKIGRKYDVQVAPVCEVSLKGSADLEFWRQRLAPEGLFPTVENGRAKFLICAAEAKFMGLTFRELSISVAVCRREGGADWDGAFLVHAFNSIRFFAFIERTLFGTPYRHAGVRVDVGLPAVAEVTCGGQTLLRLEMSCDDAAVTRQPNRDEVDGFEGPIFLPGAPLGKPLQGRLFFGRLHGQTQVYPFLPTDRVLLSPTADCPVLQWLVDSNFRGEEWSIRRDATHGKSKTTRRTAAADWFDNR